MKKPNLYERTMALLRATKLGYKDISQLAEVSERTVHYLLKDACGGNEPYLKNPGVHTIQKVHDSLKKDKKR